MRRSCSRSRSRDRSPNIRVEQKNLDAATKETLIKKCFISRNDPLGQRSVEDIKIYREKNGIFLRHQSAECPPPFMNFDDCVTVPQTIIDCMKNAGFKGPSPIQAQSWSIALNGNDLIGISETGSGKTLAFLLPAVVHIKAQKPLQPGDGPIALVLSPTRELSEQTKEQFNRFAKSSGLRAVCIYGGQPKYIQKAEIQRGAEIAIACPGRLNDFLDSNIISLSRVTYLVLDEADRMLDMGFEPQIRRIVCRTRSDRQTILFSATWPREIQSLAQEFCQQRFIHIQIGDQNITANPRIKQIIYLVRQHEKLRKLVEILKHYGNAKYLVFCGTKRGCEETADFLNHQGFSSTSLHGDKSQDQRDQAMQCFRNNQAKLLIATDVAQRGLDIKDIQYVINFDMTKQLEDYVHRIGRTGRGGNSGVAISLFDVDTDYKMVQPLIQFFKEANQELPSEIMNL